MHLLQPDYLPVINSLFPMRPFSSATSSSTEASSTFSSTNSNVSAATTHDYTNFHSNTKIAQRKTSAYSLANHARYSLQRLHSHSTTTSAIKTTARIPLSLKLTAHEIKKLRSSWNSMLNDIYDDTSDSSEEDLSRTNAHSQSPFPHANNSHKTQQSERSGYAAAGVASSIFCRQLYMNLVHRHPDLESMFPTIVHQASALSGVITIAVNSLENIHVLSDYLSSIGKRHSRVLGIEAEHFEMMADALITTFEDRFGEHFTFELEDLWLKLYQYLANMLLENYTEDFILQENGTVVPNAIVILDPLTGLPAADADNCSHASDSESMISSGSFSVRQKEPGSSLETALTKISINNDSEMVQGDSVIPPAKKNPLLKLYNFYKPKALK